MVRWFRNTLKGSGLEFGCELLSDNPEAAAAASGGRGRRAVSPPVVVLPEDANGAGPEPSPPQLLVPAGPFQVEQGITLRRGNDTGFAVLTEARRAGPRLRALRIRRGRLTRVGARRPPAAPSLAAHRGRADSSRWRSARIPLGNAARAAAPGRLVARAEGACRWRSCGPASRAGRRAPGRSLAAVAVLLRRGARACADRNRAPRGGRGGAASRLASATAGVVRASARSVVLTHGTALTGSARSGRRRRRRVAGARKPFGHRKHDVLRARRSSSRHAARAERLEARDHLADQHLGRRRARRDADARLPATHSRVAARRRDRPCTPERRDARRPRAGGWNWSCSGCRRRSRRRPAAP